MSNSIGRRDSDAPASVFSPYQPASDEAIVRRAAEDVELAFRFLSLAGVIAPEKARAPHPCAVPLEVILKAAAIMRLVQWQSAGAPPAGYELPSPQELLDDLAKLPDTERFEARRISRDVLGVWMSTMSWRALRPGADVIVRDVQPQSVADELAQLLWQFRHLLDNTNGKDRRNERTHTM